MQPLYARSKRGERAFSVKCAKKSENISMIGSIRLEGMTTLHAFDGSVCSEKFCYYLKEYLAPTLADEDVVIMDNCRTHHSRQTRATLEELGIRVLFLPPYSPELNPIEESWSPIKNHLRREKPQEIESYVSAVKSAKNLITPQKCAGFFRSARRSVQNLF